jgi:site-specific DNA-methyltransferase (adenine-specific)
MPPDSFDMVVTSPPYNVGVVYGDSDYKEDSLDAKDYHAWAKNVMGALFPLVKSGGRVCWEIGGNGRNLPLSYFWTDAALLAGFGYFGQIGLQHRKTNPCAWGSWMKADNVFTIPNFHQILVFYKDTATKRGAETTIEKEEFVEWTRGYWNINFSIGSTKEHPAQFPLELVTRCIKLFGHKGDIVLDPFFGSGTTAIACHKFDRKAVGIELRPCYVDLAKKRIIESLSQLELSI